MPHTTGVKTVLFNKLVHKTYWTATYEMSELEHFTYAIYKNHSKQIKGLKDQKP